MYLKIALRNAKRSAGDYLLYIVTMTILIAIMGISNFIAIVGRVQAGFQTASLPFLITLVLVILASYINNFLLKQRAKEFASYFLLGMEKRKVSWMFLIEFFVIGLFCFAMGNVIGLGFYIMFRSFQGSGLSFFSQSFIQTFLYFCIVEFLSTFHIKRKIDKLEIRELMIEKECNQKSRGKQRVWLWGILYIINFLCLTGMLFAIVILPENRIDMIISFIMLPLLFAIFTFYKWLYQFFAAKRDRQSESLYLRNRLYIIAQMTSETKTSTVMNSVFCICLIFSAMSFVFGVLMFQPAIETFSTQDKQWMGFLQISLSIVFIVIYFSILSLQQIIDLKRKAKDIQFLHYAGKNKEQLRVLIIRQIQIKLFLPTLMCIVPLLIAVPLLDNKLNMVLPVTMKHILIKSIFIFFLCFFALYLCYFFVVFITSRRYVENSIHTNF